MAVVHPPGLSEGARPRISVCVANFNGEALLRDCIDSVLAQDTETTIEVIVHDDASSDGSVALLRSAYPQVRVLESPENMGYCIANNRMVEAASGDYVLLLNNDAALYPDALRRLLSAADAAAGPVLLTLPQYDWDSGRLVDRGCLLDPLHVPVPNLDPDRREVAYAIGACLWVPRSTWKALDGFPEWFGSIAEDMYLCLAARLRGAPTLCLPNSGYRHRQGASFGGNRILAGKLNTRFRRRYLSERNRLFVLAMCTPTWLAWPWLALHVAALVAEGLALSLAQRDLRPWRRIYGRAILDAWRLRRTLIRQRGRLQGERSLGIGDYLRPRTWRPWKLVLLWRHGLPRID